MEPSIFRLEKTAYMLRKIESGNKSSDSALYIQRKRGWYLDDVARALDGPENQLAASSNVGDMLTWYIDFPRCMFVS